MKLSQQHNFNWATERTESQHRPQVISPVGHQMAEGVHHTGLCVWTPADLPSWPAYVDLFIRFYTQQMRDGVNASQLKLWRRDAKPSTLFGLAARVFLGSWGQRLFLVQNKTTRDAFSTADLHNPTLSQLPSQNRAKRTSLHCICSMFCWRGHLFYGGEIVTWDAYSRCVLLYQKQ